VTRVVPQRVAFGRKMVWPKLSKRGRPAQFRFHELAISLFLGPFDRRDIWRLAQSPVPIRVASVYSHRFGDEMDPVADTNLVLAVQRRQFAMAGMKDRANGVAAVGCGGAPGRVSGGGERAGNRGQRAACGRDGPALRSVQALKFGTTRRQRGC
jgi:hypothetical protein